ncbi:MAG: peptide ABC transporter permease, partial [Tissierellia bacterium]|nr:peptide ABC transporter permease [Tissierellia bacterium]
MNEKDNKTRPPKKTGMIKQLFGKREVGDIFQEEQIQGPWRTVMKTFFSKKINIFSTAVFLFIAFILVVFPLFKPVVLSDQETTQQDLAPGRSMMKIPDDNYRVISQGKSFGVGLTEDGKINFWGNAKVGKLDLAKIPDEILNAQIEDISVGFDHILALDNEGKVYSWGNNRLRQTKLPPDVAKMTNVKQVVAGLQISLIVTEDN